MKRRNSVSVEEGERREEKREVLVLCEEEGGVTWYH